MAKGAVAKFKGHLDVRGSGDIAASEVQGQSLWSGSQGDEFSWRIATSTIFLSLRRRRLYVFGSSVRAAVRACVRPSVRDSRGSFMFPRYLQYLVTDFRRTFVTGASRDRDELIRFWVLKVKVQGHTTAAEAHSTRRYRRVQLFLVQAYDEDFVFCYANANFSLLRLLFFSTGDVV